MSRIRLHPNSVFLSLPSGANDTNAYSQSKCLISRHHNLGSSPLGQRLLQGFCNHEIVPRCVREIFLLMKLSSYIMSSYTDHALLYSSGTNV